MSALLIANRNITEQTRTKKEKEIIDKKLKQAQSQFIHSTKLISLEEMATSVAHEINQPIMIMSMAAEMGIEYLKKQKIDNALKDFQKILDQVQRTAIIINNLKTFGRETSELPYEPSPIRPIVDDAVDHLKNELEKNYITLTKEYNDDLSNLHCNAIQIRQLLLKLLTNSIEAVEHLHKKQIMIRLFKEGHWIVIDIEDTGCGVTLSLQDKIFEPFFTTKELGQGAGLGLSICYGIVKDHAGKLEVISNGKNGAIFRVKLPISL